jgi:hypothetical protein
MKTVTLAAAGVLALGVANASANADASAARKLRQEATDNGGPRAGRDRPYVVNDPFRSKAEVAPSRSGFLPEHIFLYKG